MNKKIILQSIITCPECGFKKEETMPTDSCQFFYECTNCGKVLKPKSGDCCVFVPWEQLSVPQVRSLGSVIVEGAIFSLKLFK